MPALKGEAIQSMLAQVPGWEAPNGHHLFRSYKFPDFRTALDFVNRAGAVAEEQGHHPDLMLTWGKVEITIYTHTENGLTEKDFKLAAAINAL